MKNSLIDIRKLEWVGLGRIPAIEFLVDQLVGVSKAYSPHWRLVIVIDISVDVEIITMVEKWHYSLFSLLSGGI